jgi:hypothetical protein
MEFCLEYIRQEPNRQAIERMLTMTVRKPPPPPPVLSQAEVDAEVSFILAHEQVRSYPEDELALIMEGLREQRRQCIERKDYLGANKAEHLAQVALSHGQLSAVEAMQESKCQFYQNMIDVGEETQAQKEARWEELHARLLEAAANDYSDLAARHAEEVDGLEAMKDDIPPGWRKFSASLWQLRRREAAMVDTRQFREAARMKAHADEVAEKEKREMQRRWIQEIDQRIENARALYAKQLETRKLFWAGESAKLLSQAQKEGALAHLAIGHLQESLRGAKKALELTCDLKKQNESRQGDARGSVTGRISPRARATVHGQRRILNSRIYTRTPQTATRKRQSSSAIETWSLEGPY